MNGKVECSSPSKCPSGFLLRGGYRAMVVRVGAIRGPHRPGWLQPLASRGSAIK